MKNSLTGSLHVICFTSMLMILNACGEDYYSVDDFYSIQKIDTHVHINVLNSVMVEQAREDNFRLLTVNVNSGRMPVSEQRAIAAQLSQQNPDYLSYLTTFSLDEWDDTELWINRTLDYLEESFLMGAMGVKVWKNIGMELINADGEFVMIDDPQFDPVFEYLVEQNKPLLGHIGEPRNCWLPLDEMTVNNDREYFENNPQYHMYLHPDYPSYEEIIETRNNMLDKHPDLVFIGAHLGSMEWSIEMMAEHLDRYPNMYYDMAHRVPHLQYLAQQDRNKLRDFFIEYQDRFVYSTDLSEHAHHYPDEVEKLVQDTWREDWEFFVTDNQLSVWQVDGSFQGLKLPKTVVDKLYRKNAESIFPDI